MIAPVILASLLSTSPAHAIERTFKCLAKAHGIVMLIGTYESATNEPTGPVALGGSYSMNRESAPNVFGTPDTPRVFDQEGLTLDYETYHDEFVLNGFGDGRDTINLRYAPSSGGTVALQLGQGRYEGRLKIVSCLFTDGVHTSDWTWPNANDGWPY